jgi:signal peptidase I
MFVDTEVRGIIRGGIVQAWRTPSESMLPTLEVGDCLYIDKTSAGRQGLHRGDIVVFPYPVDPSKDFIKRIVGLPNETIEIRNKQVFINNQALNEPCRGTTTSTHRDGTAWEPASRI